MSDLDRYRLPESSETLVVLRGHDEVGPKVATIAGVLLLLASLYPLYYALAVRYEVGAFAAFAGAVLVGVALLGWARLRRAKPDRKTYVDLAGQRLWTSNHGEQTEPLAFADLGTLKAGQVSSYDAKTRTARSILAVSFSKHEGYVLYVPWNGADMVRFVNTLRALVGEEHLPRATPKQS